MLSIRATTRKQILFFLFVFQSCPTLQRLAAVHGLVALVGSESYLFQVTVIITRSCTFPIQTPGVGIAGYLTIQLISEAYDPINCD